MNEYEHQRRSDHGRASWLALFAAVLVGACASSAPQESPPQSVDAVRTTLLEIVDDEGRVAIRMHATGGGGGVIDLLNPEGHEVITLVAGIEGAGAMKMAEAHGEARVLLTAHAASGALELRSPTARTVTRVQDR